MFLPVVLIILGIFTKTLRRRYVILTLSALLPLITVFGYYWLVDKEPGYFIVNFVQPSLSVDFSTLVTIGANVGLLLPVLIFWFLGIVTMPKQRRLNNYQSRLAQLFFITGLLSLLILLFKSADIITGIILLVPVAAFFTTHLFFLVKRSFLDLITLLVFLSLIILTSYDSEFGVIGLNKTINQELKVEPELEALIKHKKIMVLGDKQQLYMYGSLATPFYDWSLSKAIVDNLEYYDNVVFVKESMDKYQPEIILDYELKWQKIIMHIPEFNQHYNQIRPFVWLRIK